MLNEDTRLAEAVKELVNDIGVSARNRTSALRVRPDRYRLVAAAAAGALLVVGAAFVAIRGASTPGTPATHRSVPGNTILSPTTVPLAASNGTGTGVGVTAGSNAAGGASTASSQAGGEIPTAPPLPAGAQIATRVIKTGDIDLVVAAARVSPTINQLTTLAAGLGGYIHDSKTSESVDHPTGDVTISVPSNQFEALLARVRSLGKPASVSTSGQDVTSQYVDLQARISALQSSRDRYLEILRRAQSVGDILAVQQQIDTVQGQLEQLQGQLTVLDGQTSFATLAVHVSADVQPLTTHVPRPAAGWSKAWAHARHSFAGGIDSVVAASGGIAVFLLVAGALLGVARLTWSVMQRRAV